MTAQALYRKWRPQTFDEIVGQEHVVRTLRNALASGRIHHAYLFAGPRGTGKTTTARLLAKAVNCLAPQDQRPCNQCAICQAINEGRLLDLIEIDAASNTGVDDVRELREKVGFRPSEARYRVYVIDEVHMLSNAAFNALLKTLEEPPPHVIFVLATTEPHKIPPTVLSRCQRFNFRRISYSQIVARLQWLAEQEHIAAEPEALALVARQATGSMRDAESLLDQLASYDASGITAANVRAALGAGAYAEVFQVAEALAQGDLAQGLNVINAALDEGADPRQFARQIVEHLRALLLLRLQPDAAARFVPDDLRPQLEPQAAAFSIQSLARAVRLFTQAAVETKGGWQPQLPLEMAFIEAALPPERESSAPSSPPPTGRQRPSPAPEPRQPASGRPVSSAPQTIRESPAVYDAPPQGASALTPDILRGRWTDFLNALRPRNLSLEALVRSSEPVAVEGDVVVLGFAHNFHRSRLEEERNRQIVEDVLSDLVGRRCRVQCVLVQRDQSAPLAMPETALPPASRPADDDPVVRAAVEDLGAQVVR